MFTLNEKQRVLNANADVAIIDPTTGAVNVASTPIVSTDSIAIKGFGTFPILSITDFKARRASAAVAEVSDFLITVPTGLAIGEAVEARITYKTSRYAGEDAINYIEGSRPFVFQTAALTGVTAANIRTALVAGWASYLATFAKFDPKISVSAGAGASDLRVTVVTSYEYLTITKVEISRVVQGAGSQTKVNLAKTAITTGSEGNGLGKFLEESIRMATPMTTNPYGIGGDDWRVDVRGSYTQIYFKVAATYDDAVIPHGSDLIASSEHTYMIYLNEATCLGSDNAIENLAEVGVIVAGLLSNVAVTAIAAPLTRAEEEVEALIIATGDSVATAADFIL
jgi:hypothetical protein